MTDAPKRRRRRRRRKPERPGPNPIPAERILDRDAPSELPLREDEVRAVKEHLAFIRRFRKVLRIPFNSNENLIVDGARPIEHRGVVVHLLSKLDHKAAQAALARKPVCDDARQRARLLAGIARISGDEAVLMMYLEAITEAASHAEAAAAFGATVERIDFEQMSASRLTQLLSVLEATFEGHEQVQVLFGLLESPSFRGAFDRHADGLSSELSARFVPLRAVYDAYVSRRRRKKRSGPSPQAAAGLEQMLSAPVEILLGYRSPVRRALTRAAIRRYRERGFGAELIRTLLDSFGDKSEDFAELAWAWAQGLVHYQLDDDARGLLRRLTAVHPDHPDVNRLLAALERPRIGRFAMTLTGKHPDRLEPAYWLGHDRTVLFRWSPDAARIEAEAALQAERPVPGSTIPLMTGTTPDGRGFVAVDDARPLLPVALKTRDKGLLPLNLALRLAAQGVRVLYALSLAGVGLPDARPWRFGASLDDTFPGLVLLDYSGAAPSTAEPLAQYGLWCRDALAAPSFKKGPLRRDTPADVRALVESNEAANAARWVAVLS